MVRIAAMGDNVVDCYLSTQRMHPGGNCVNVAVYANRFGVQSSYVGAIGRDAAGDAIQSAFDAEGVDRSRLRILPGMTAYCIIGHKDADRVFIRADLGVSMFEPDAADFEHISRYDAVHIGQSSGMDDHLERAAKCTRLSYDFSTRRDDDHRARIAPHCYLASISAGDGSHDDALALAELLLADGARWALVTRGRHGAMLRTRGETFEVPAHPVKPVDTLGAGDTFVARTLVGLLNGEPPREIMPAAAEAAARTCLHHGAFGHDAPLSLRVAVPELVSVGG